MGSTEEQMQYLNDIHIDHVSYILVLFSAAFMLFLCKCLVTNGAIPLVIILTMIVVNVLIYIYYANTNKETIKLDPESHRPLANGRLNGDVIHGADEYELHGLASDDEENDEEQELLKEQIRGRDQ